MNEMATVGFSKVFILDKYFTELQKFWETEKKLQGMQADSSNEKADLQQRLKSLSSELVSLRNRIGVSAAPPLQKLILGSNPPQVVNTNSPQILNGRRPPAVSTGHQVYAKPLPPPRPSGYSRQFPGHEGTKSQGQIPNYQNTTHSSQQVDQSSNFYVNQPHVFGRDGGDLVSEKHSGSIVGTRTTSSGGDFTPSVSSRSSTELKGQSTSNVTRVKPGEIPQPKRVQLSTIEDLIHLPGALTEDSLIRSLQARCTAGKNFVYMGPILLLANTHSVTENPLTLNSTQTISIPLPIQKVVKETLRQQADTGYPQAIVLSGCSGSGKTYASMLILRQLFEICGGGLESDAFKHLTASVSVIRSFGTARTASNAESSRIGHFVEAQVTDGTLYRTKVHCYFLDQTRLVKTSPDERNYHIFYQMLAGLQPDERNKLYLTQHSAKTLRYLNTSEQQSDNEEDSRRFQDWKTCLCVLGIPFLDVLRVLSAVVLIGNVQFKESKSHITLGGACSELEVEEGESELQSAAALLGVSETALKQGLTWRTHNARGHLVRSRCDATFSNTTRDSLAKSLYCRTVATIVRRANSLKRLHSTSGTMSSDSADSINNHAEVASQHASTVGTAGSKASKSMTALMAAVRHATDGFIGVLDMFGFEDIKRSRLEHLCINLCSETMQHFYNTHIFKACVESCRDEGIRCDDIDYHDNVPCIDLISSLRTGLLSMLDVECSLRGPVESYVQKVQSQHRANSRFLETKSTDLRSFAIQHYTGKVFYDVTDFPETNRDVLADDLVAVFHKHRCSFGFASHLFSSELKVLGASGTVDPCPKGILFRIQPTSNTEMLNGDEPVTTLTQDFHTRLDNLLRTLVHTKPHFIRCLKINESEQRDLFDRYTVSKQLRSFQVLETVNLMANGYPHRIRFKAFNTRYKILGPKVTLSMSDHQAVDDSRRILDTLASSERLVSHGLAIGKRHVFLSEGVRQQLEALRLSIRAQAATLIQSAYRGWYCRRRWPTVRQSIQLYSKDKKVGRGKPAEPRAVLQAETITPKTSWLDTTAGQHLEVETLCQAYPVMAHGRTPSTAVVTSCATNVAHQNYKNLPAVIHGVAHSNQGDTLSRTRPRPHPIAGTPPPDAQAQANLTAKQVQATLQTCQKYVSGTHKPPQLPAARQYTVMGSRKFTFPQRRVMRRSFLDERTSIAEQELVGVIGPSPRRGYLMVEHKNRLVHLPHQLLELRSSVQ